MPNEHSKLSRKLLRQFFFRYTRIVLAISVLVLAVTVFFYSRYAERTAREHMALAADALSDFQTNIQEDTVYLLSDSSLKENIAGFYKTGGAGELSAVNLRLRSIKTSDTDLLFVMMDDLNGNIFHSLVSGSDEIISSLTDQDGYRRMENVNTSEFSPICSSTVHPAGMTDAAVRAFTDINQYFCIYHTRYDVGRGSFLVTMVFNADRLVESTASACAPLDRYCLCSNRDIVLYSNAPMEDLLPEDFGATANSRGRLTRNGYFYLHNQYSVYAVGCITTRTILTRFFMLFLLLMVVYLVPILLSIFSLYPAAERLLHPLYDLNRQVQKFSIGEPPVEIIRTGDEIENLSTSIRDMSVNINAQALEITEKEREKALTYYKLLTTQLDPHFIYNTMNIINILARRGACDDIVLVNTALTRVLRERLNTQNTTFSPVKEEIETLKQYLLIMDYRYHHQVLVDFNIDDAAMDLLIPKNILQPIIENSYYHGLTQDDGEIRGSISLFIYPDAEDLVMEIADDGKGIDPDRLDYLKSHDFSLNTSESKRSHIGIENIYRRLQYLYGSGFSLDIQSTSGSGTTVIIAIPLLKELPETGRTSSEAPPRPDPDSPI